jgi:hypothetical protein
MGRGIYIQEQAILISRARVEAVHLRGPKGARLRADWGLVDGGRSAAAAIGRQRGLGGLPSQLTNWRSRISKAKWLQSQGVRSLGPPKGWQGMESAMCEWAGLVARVMVPNRIQKREPSRFLQEIVTNPGR